MTGFCCSLSLNECPAQLLEKLLVIFFVYENLLEVRIASLSGQTKYTESRKLLREKQNNPESTEANLTRCLKA